jgi:hypothetical protein
MGVAGLEHPGGPSNRSFTILASAARTADASLEVTNYGWRGILIQVDCTVDPAAAAVTVKVQAKDEAGGWDDIFVAAAPVNAVAKYSYLVYPGVIAADFDGTEAVSLALPREMRILLDHADAASITYSVRGHFIL